jgi:hypothetical protein
VGFIPFDLRYGPAASMQMGRISLRRGALQVLLQSSCCAKESVFWNALGLALVSLKIGWFGLIAGAAVMR